MNLDLNVINTKKVAFTTLGCKVNLYDTEAMIELFEQAENNLNNNLNSDSSADLNNNLDIITHKFIITDFDDFADIYIINTCSVTNLGDKKSRQMIRKAKAKNPNAIVIATGCYSQVAPEEVSKIDGVSIIIGTKDRLKIVEIVHEYEINNISNDGAISNDILNKVSDIMQEKSFEPLTVSSLKNRTRAYLKIQEGCNKYCSYCIIPFTRGNIRSRNPEDVILEVEQLAKNGFKEVVLTGIHILSYGVDLKPDENNNKINLIKIIKRVHEVEGIERIRFSSIEPVVITDEFISEIKNLPKVCDHYHLSLQSGCDNTLNRMNRKYTSEDYKNALVKLREAFPNVAITTDVIVGFPDETLEDYQDSFNFVEQNKITKVHAFPYSPKKGTKASLFKNQIPNDEKSGRNKKMIELSNKLNIEFLESMLNKTMPVLFEREREDNVYEGHTTNYIKVLTRSEENIVNKIIDVELLSIQENATETVFGEIINNK